MNQPDYSLTQVVRTIVSKRKTIFKSVLGIMAAAAIFSLLVPVYYTATTVFYAASPDLGLPNSVSSNELPKSVYGSEYDIDRLLSIAESEDVYSQLINTFDLYAHYDIDSTKVKAPYIIREELKDHYRVLKTKLDAIEISVEDQDPKFAANMANKAREIVSERSQLIMKSSQKQNIDAISKGLIQEQVLAKKLADSIMLYKQQFHIVDTKSQGEAYAEIVSETKADFIEKRAMLEYFKASKMFRDSVTKYTIKTNALEKKVVDLEAELELFYKGKSLIEKFELDYERLISQMALDRQRSDQLAAAFNSPFTTVHLVETASPPVVKSKPRRSLIVLVAGLLGFLFTTAFILLSHHYTIQDIKNLWNAQL